MPIEAYKMICYSFVLAIHLNVTVSSYAIFHNAFVQSIAKHKSCRIHYPPRFLDSSKSPCDRLCTDVAVTDSIKFSDSLVP